MWRRPIRKTLNVPRNGLDGLVKPAERDEGPERDPAGVLVAHRHQLAPSYHFISSITVKFSDKKLSVKASRSEVSAVWYPIRDCGYRTAHFVADAARAA